MNLLFHSETKNQVDKFVANFRHGLLIEGPAGSGKGTIADHVASRLLGVDALVLANYPYFARILPEKDVISIEVIRAAQQLFQLKTLGKNPVRRILIVEDAQYLTTEAQNAFLKLLEEPPADTVIILTANQDRMLQPTIASRLQSIKISNPAKAELVGHFASLGMSSAKIERAYNISGAQIGLMSAVLSDDDNHPMLAAIDKAKEILKQTTFERLSQVDTLSKQKNLIPGLVLGLQRVYEALLDQAIRKNDTKLSIRARTNLGLLLEAQEKLLRNPNMKLLLTDLFLNI